MMTAMKGATTALSSMNRSMNLPALQRIAMEFERENDIMEQRQDIMDDSIDDAMDVGIEEEGDEVVEQVLEEIGVDLNSAVSRPCVGLQEQEPTRLTDYLNSLERHRLVSRLRRLPTPVLRRQSAVLAVEAAAAAAAVTTTISRLDSIASGSRGTWKMIPQSTYCYG